MRFADFSRNSLAFWRKYFSQVASAERKGRLKVTSGKVVLYPNTLLCTKTDEFFIAELMGSQKAYGDLVMREHEEPSVNRYFSQFDPPTEPGVLVDAALNYFDGLQFSAKRDDEALRGRFPFVRTRDVPTITGRANSEGSALGFGPRANLLGLANCTIINTYKSAIRVKEIRHLDIVRRDTSAADHMNLLRSYLKGPEVHGVVMCSPGDEERFVTAGNFASVFLQPGLRETTISTFLRTHPKVLERAFCSPRVLYAPEFRWIDGPANAKGSTIIPDLLVSRPDGPFDIYDIKLALLDRTALTKGLRARRRFVDYVEEGIAQLANYEEYFKYPQNSAHAIERYGVRVEQPRLGLVVGNRENVDRVAIDEACRRLKTFELVDYDTLLHNYLESTCA